MAHRSIFKAPAPLLLALVAASLPACSSAVAAVEENREHSPSTTAPAQDQDMSAPHADATTTLDSAAMTNPEDKMDTSAEDNSGASAGELETLTLASGCFWCSEAVLEQVDGVRNVVSGYMGGETPDPTYKQICTGRTGHAEVIQVQFDPEVLPLDNILAWFWKLHDPTTLNRQGADVGTQYRSAIFYHSEQQRAAAQRSKEAHQTDFSDPIVTEITAASRFYPAEDYHQDYYRANKDQGYCRAVIAPKLDKLDLKK